MITFALCIVILIVCLQGRVENERLEIKLDKILKHLGIEEDEE